MLNKCFMKKIFKKLFPAANMSETNPSTITLQIDRLVTFLFNINNNMFLNMKEPTSFNPPRFLANFIFFIITIAIAKEKENMYFLLPLLP